MRLFQVIAIVLGLFEGASCTSLWKKTTPQHPEPYALRKGDGISLGSGDTWNTFLATGNSSGKAFTIMNTNGPGASSQAGVFPHVHNKTYENFYSAKGRVQLWGQNLDSYQKNTSTQSTRILSQGDFGGIPTNTIHTFSLLEPDTQLTGVLVPGGFEEFFFSMAANMSAGRDLNFSNLPAWDVYPQLDFVPRTDVVNNKAGSGSWYDGPNDIPPDDKNPIWIAKNYGPKHLVFENGQYQIITPLVMGLQTRNLFAQGHITMSLSHNKSASYKISSPHATAFTVEEGQLAVTVDGFETAHLIDGDIVFVPPETTFAYYAEAEFTKFMYVSGGGNGLDDMLLKKSIPWDSAFYPREKKSDIRRGMKI